MNWRLINQPLGLSESPIGSRLKIAPAVAAAAITGGAAIANGVGNLLSQANANKTNLQGVRETNAQNKELFERQLAWEEDMWNKSNAYNDPSAQVARLEAAGINPAFVLGNGSMAESSPMSSPSAPQLQAPKVEPLNFSGVSEGVSKLGSQLMEYYMFKEKMDQDWVNILKDTDLEPETKNSIIKNKLFKSDNRTRIQNQLLAEKLQNVINQNALQQMELNIGQERNEELRKQWNRNKERHVREMNLLIKQALNVAKDTELKGEDIESKKKLREIVDEQINRYRRLNGLFSGEEISFRAVLEMIHDLFSGGLVGLIGALK